MKIYQVGTQSLYWICISLLFISFSFYISISIYSGQSQNQNGRLIQNSERKTVLVTGAAGFIGFHLSLNLHQQGHRVIAVDNFNDYYDVRLKIDRAYELHKKGIRIYAEDVCTVSFLEEVFQNNSITHVAHLAAQAGVRYSLKNPQAYIKANVECQLALINVMKDYKDIKLVYASSSSVYGKEADVPFQLTARTDRPGNMYAATKKTDELLGLHYCHAYGIVSVGLRFFTVYGPWGRPDMSVYTFADAIYNKKKLPMFYISEDKPLGRDFTYVDDVVAGIVAALDYRPARCGEKFNLGFGHPVSVIEMISMMEKEIGIKADIEKLPMPPTEILQTWADISTSAALLGFQPHTNLTIGIREFIAWFKPYQENRQNEKKQSQHSASELWFAGIYEDQLQRHKRYNRNKEDKEIQRILHSFQHEKEKYLAEHQKKEFEIFEKMTWKGYDLVTYNDYRHNVAKLTELCEAIPVCVAFTSEGTLKSHVPPKSLWLKSQSDVYVVKQNNWCEGHGHTCHVDSICTTDLPNLYKCKCEDNFWGSGHQCVPIQGKVSKVFLHERYSSYYQNIFNASQMKVGKEVVKIQVERRDGDDLMYLPYAGNDVQQIQAVCSTEPICIGFTSDGRLKYRIPPPSTESNTEKKASTLEEVHVFNINYCVFNEEACPDNSHCALVAAGDSRCVCSEDYLMVNSECIKPFLAKSLVPSLAHCTGTTC